MCCCAINSQAIVIVAPSHVAARNGIGSGSAAVASEPCVEISCVASRPSHSAVASTAARSMAGAMVSSMVNAVVLPSVKVTVAVPVAPQCAAVAAVVGRREGHGRHPRCTAIVAQRGEVVAPGHIAASIRSEVQRHRCWGRGVFDQPCVEISCVASARRCSAVASTAAMSMDGAVVSSIVNVAVVLLLLPQSSVAVKVTVAIPVAPQSSLKEAKSLLQVTSLQASESPRAPSCCLPQWQAMRRDQLRCRHRRIQRSHPWQRYRSLEPRRLRS